MKILYRFFCLFIDAPAFLAAAENTLDHLNKWIVGENLKLDLGCYEPA